MSSEELQQEELEVLKSIYDGEEHFKQISEKVFQYKVGEEGEARTFLLELTWADNYPEDLPQINMNMFYNKHLTEEVKSTIVQAVKDQAETMLGMAMTYTLFEYVKENAEDLFSRAPQPSTTSTTSQVISCTDPDASTQLQASNTTAAKNKDKKEQLTKAQKRKLVTRQDINGEMARGWNWVDVVKHLCQTGQGKSVSDSNSAAANTT